MITPWFKLEQSDEYLFIKIKAPYAKVALDFSLFLDNQQILITIFPILRLVKSTFMLRIMILDSTVNPTI
jgi:hypothetical protein